MFNWGGNTNFHSMNLDWLIQFAKDAQETINNALAAIQAAIAQISGKQDMLVSGQNIKTINGETVLGSGNLEISGGSGDVSSVNGMTGDVVLDAYDLAYGDDTVGTVLNDIEDDVDELRQDVDAAETDISSIQTDIGSIQTALSGKQATLISGQNIKTINGEPVLGSGNLEISGGAGGSMIYSQTDSITLSNHNTVVINNPVNVYIEFPDIDTDEEFEARVALSGSYSMSYDESVPVGFDLIWKDGQTPNWQDYTAYLITYRLLGVTSINDLIIIMASYEEVSL